MMDFSGFETNKLMEINKLISQLEQLGFPLENEDITQELSSELLKREENKIYEMIDDYKRTLGNVWDYITNLLEFGNPCLCNTKVVDDEFDTIDYTGDEPSIRKWCLKCGGYRE